MNINDTWINVTDANRINPEEFLIRFSEVVRISYMHNEAYPALIVFETADEKTFYKQCNSELEMQMIYAKLKKMLCKDGELSEIL